MSSLWGNAFSDDDNTDNEDLDAAQTIAASPKRGPDLLCGDAKNGNHETKKPRLAACTHERSSLSPTAKYPASCSGHSSKSATAGLGFSSTRSTADVEHRRGHEGTVVRTTGALNGTLRSQFASSEHRGMFPPDQSTTMTAQGVNRLFSSPPLSGRTSHSSTPTERPGSVSHRLGTSVARAPSPPVCTDAARGAEEADLSRSPPAPPRISFASKLFGGRLGHKRALAAAEEAACADAAARTPSAAALAPSTAAGSRVVPAATDAAPPQRQPVSLKEKYKLSSLAGAQDALFARVLPALSADATLRRAPTLLDDSDGLNQSTSPQAAGASKQAHSDVTSTHPTSAVADSKHVHRRVDNGGRRTAPTPRSTEMPTRAAPTTKHTSISSSSSTTTTTTTAAPSSATSDARPSLRRPSPPPAPVLDSLPEERWPKLQSALPFDPVAVPLVLDSERRIQVQAHMNQYLRSFQKDGVKWLYSRYKEGVGGILADPMGMGKTVQVIAFIAALLGKKGDKADRLALPAPSVATEGAFLVVLPASLLGNWESELNTWGCFSVGVCHGAKKEGVLDEAQKANLEVVLSSYETVRSNLSNINMVNWRAVFCDEVHRLKSDKSSTYQTMRMVSCDIRFGLTGTPIQNRLEEIWCVLDWAVPNCLGEKASFKTYYADPIRQGQRSSATQEQLGKNRVRAKELNEVMAAHMLQRSKRLISDQLPGKDDSAVFCKLSHVQQTVYRRVLESPMFQLIIRHDEPCDCGSRLSRGQCCYETDAAGTPWRNHVLSALTTLQKISNHLDLIKVNKSDPPEKQAKDRALAEIAFASKDPAVVEQQHQFLATSDATHCGKMQVLGTLLSLWQRQGSKVLLFSYSRRMLDVLTSWVIRQGYVFLRLDGETPPSQRQALVEEYNRNDGKFLFLISTRAGGEGLNLTSASVVVIFDPNWNPAHDLQAQDRTFRIGQRRHVTVYRLLAAGSLEELVYTRQIYKQQMAGISAGSEERRYFEGVEKKRGQEGELFGIKNLFSMNSSLVMTQSILDRHSDIEASYLVAEMPLKTRAPPSVVADELAVGDLPVATEDEYDITHVIKQLIPEHSIDIPSVLKKSGVVYSHLNSSVLGSSCVEQRVSAAAASIYQKSEPPRKIHQTSLVHGRGRSRGIGRGRGRGRASATMTLTLSPKPAHNPAAITSGALDDATTATTATTTTTTTTATAAASTAASTKEQFAAEARRRGMTPAAFAAMVTKMSADERAALLADMATPATAKTASTTAPTTSPTTAKTASTTAPTSPSATAKTASTTAPTTPSATAKATSTTARASPSGGATSSSSTTATSSTTTNYANNKRSHPHTTTGAQVSSPVRPQVAHVAQRAARTATTTTNSNNTNTTTTTASRPAHFGQGNPRPTVPLFSAGPGHQSSPPPMPSPPRMPSPTRVPPPMPSPPRMSPPRIPSPPPMTGGDRTSPPLMADGARSQPHGGTGGWDRIAVAVRDDGDDGRHGHRRHSKGWDDSDADSMFDDGDGVAARLRSPSDSSRGATANQSPCTPRHRNPSPPQLRGRVGAHSPPRPHSEVPGGERVLASPVHTPLAPRASPQGAGAAFSSGDRPDSMRTVGDRPDSMRTVGDRPDSTRAVGALTPLRLSARLSPTPTQHALARSSEAGSVCVLDAGGARREGESARGVDTVGGAHTGVVHAPLSPGDVDGGGGGDDMDVLDVSGVSLAPAVVFCSPREDSCDLWDEVA